MLQTRALFKYSGSAYAATYKKFSSKVDAKTFAKKKILYGNLFPDNMLTKKHKSPEAIYLAHAEGAQIIMKAIEPHLVGIKYNTLLEVNPGVGILTRCLLDHEEFEKFILMESNEHFMVGLQELLAFYEDKIKLEYGDMISLWKLTYQDKQDNGTRVADLLQSVPRRKYNDDPNMLLIAASGAYNFYKHLINSVVFQNSLLSLGRPEMFIILPPPIYIHLTCDTEIGYLIYRSTSILFQILFEYRFVTTIPRDYFLPTQSEIKLTKTSKLARITSINPEYLYLVKIVPRRNLFELCAPEDLPALWYFIKQNCVSRRNRVIPNLEKWVSGCGPRLLINKEKPVGIHQLYPDEDLKKLPQYSRPCTSMSDKNFLPDMNIFTQFGDLNPSQMLTLFKQFRSWPEYSESPFLASLENSLLKMETSADESVNGIVDEDDSVSGEVAEIRTALEKAMQKAAEDKLKEGKAEEGKASSS